MLTSQLPALSRELMLVLATRINARTGDIQPRHQPSLNVLARQAGMSRRSVMRHLRHLERDGWLHRQRPDPAEARTQYRTTQYELVLPRASQTPPLGPERHRSRASATRGLGPGRPPKTERETDRSTSAAAGRDDELITIATEELAAARGKPVDRATAAEVVRLVLAGRADVRNPGPYLRRAIREHPDRYLPKSSGPPRYSDGKFIE